MKRIMSASVDITYDCNFRCLHCFNSSGEHTTSRQYLNDHEIIRVVKELAELEPKSICLCGGETMLRKEVIYKILDEINRGMIKKVPINCVSNGYLIDETVAATLGEKGLNHIQISMDGATAETHDWLRNKPGSFEKVIHALYLLSAQKIFLAVSFTPTKRNLNELEDAMNMAYNLGVNLFRVQPTMNLGRARKNLDNYLLDDNDYMKVKYVIEKVNIKHAKNNDFSAEWGDPLDHLHIGKTNNYYTAINAYGDIIVSPYLPITVGNVKEKSYTEYIENGVLDVWSNPFIDNVARKLTAFKHMDISEIGLPEIYLGENINLDILDSDYQEKTKTLMKYFSL